MMNISEKDLYKYVIDPDELSVDKITFIINNLDKFADQIVFLEQFRNNLKTETPSETIDRILEKISNTRTRISIPLHKLSDNYCENADYLTLAAASPNSIDEVQFSSFQSEKKDFLVKVNSTLERTKIFLLGNNLSKEKSYSLIVHPSGEQYQIDLDNQPLITNPINRIDSLDLVAN